ncbi:MAG: winged helix-turn-helix domain-containing protein [Lachnospiraceae bacterium]|nr:winged helix-turn-helix domain-containing protein [Lachnospiraceae bacterium]
MSTSDINPAIAEKLNLSEEQLSLESSNCSGSEYSYRMQWAQTELKQHGFIINPKHGKWTFQ